MLLAIKTILTIKRGQVKVVFKMLLEEILVKAYLSVMLSYEIDAKVQYVSRRHIDMWPYNLTFAYMTAFL